jgi:hypothetical protein
MATQCEAALGMAANQLDLEGYPTVRGRTEGPSFAISVRCVKD